MTYSKFQTKSALFGVTPVSPTLTTDEERALRFLLPMSEDYPDIEYWFRQKVVPGLRIGSRNLILIERGDEVAGLGIAKNEDAEQKICTVRVSSNFYGRGIGVRIFDNLMTWLGNDKPHLTVSQSKVPEFERLFDHYGFKLTSVAPDFYRLGSTELYYNE